MKASKEDVQRVLHIAEPFFDEIRAEWVSQIARTMPEESAKREAFYAMVSGLNRLQRKLKDYAAPTVAAPTADQSTEVDWFGNPMKD